MPGCGLSNFIKFRLNSENRAGSARHLLIKAVVEECPKQIGGIVSEGGAAISEAVALETEAMGGIEAAQAEQQSAGRRSHWDC